MLVEKTGWTLDYIESLDMEEYRNVITIYDSVDRARNYLRSKKD